MEPTKEGIACLFENSRIYGNSFFKKKELPYKRELLKFTEIDMEYGKNTEKLVKTFEVQEKLTTERKNGQIRKPNNKREKQCPTCATPQN